MAATRLTDSQKSELVARYSAGAASAALAAAYGCSVNTVSRVVKAALAPADYERLKQARARGVAVGEPAAGEPPLPESAAEPGADSGRAIGDSGGAAGDGNGPMQVAELSPSRDHGVDDRDVAGRGGDGRDDQRAQGDLAKDLDDSDLDDPDLDDPDLDDPDLVEPELADAELADADLADAELADAELDEALDDDLDDEFGDDLEDDDLDDDLDDDEVQDDEGHDDDLGDGGELAGGSADRGLSRAMAAGLDPVNCLPLALAELPASVYLLVDKTVELEARPLSQFSELGQLPPGEEERQALHVFVNPRQAKRQCGRNQRVIKIPDARLLERTAPYLIAQGISRVVIENGLYSLPGA